MIPLPIAYREMLVLARSPAVYRGRIVISLLLLLAGAALASLYHFAGARPVMFTMMFLPMAAFFLMIYCLFAGVQATADSISREKREGTLGLLYLTHMRTGQILFGKLIANSLVVFYGLLTSFPLLSLLLLLGGIEGSGMLKLFAGSVNLLFFSASVGLFVSSLGVHRRRTAANATWLMLFFWFVPGLLAQFLMFKQAAPQWVIGLLMLLSPANIFNFVSPVPAGMDRFGISLLATHLLGWLFLALAAYHLPRRWQEKAAPAGKRTFKERWLQFCYGSTANRVRRRGKLLRGNPIFWLTARHRLKPFTSSLVMLFFIGLFLWAGYMDSTALEQFTYMLMVVLTIAQAVMLGGTAPARLNEEHEQGTLELLLSTPLSVRDFVRGNTLALFWQYAVPFLVTFGLQGMVIAWGTVESWPLSNEEDRTTFVFFLIFLGLHYLNLFTMTRYALWACVTLKQPKQAGQTTVGMIVLVPVVVFGLLMALGGFLTWYFEVNYLDAVRPWHILSLLASLYLVNDIFWLTLFRRRFAPRLREFASKRFVQEDKPGIIERIFKMFRWPGKASEPPVLAG